MTNSKRVVVTGVLVALGVGSSFAGDWYVDQAIGNDANDGLSAATPKLTIRAATTNAVANDVVHVAPGTYGDAEGSQVVTADRPAYRVVVPDGVSVVATNAEKTIILGAASTDESADEYGIGPGAIRCAYIGSNSKLSGFMLTGGRSESTYWGGAAVGVSGNISTMADCIVSNNVSYSAPLFRIKMVRCRVIYNRCTDTDTTGVNVGDSCRWIGCVIDNNRGGNIVLDNSLGVESCTFGWNRNNGGGTPQIFQPKNCVAYNSIFLYGKWYSAGTMHLTNCLMVASLTNDVNAIITNNWCNCVVVKDATAAKLNADYTLAVGSPAIDAGNLAYSSDPNGVDLYGRSRVMNGQIDIGASEFGCHWYVDSANGDDANNGLTSQTALKTIHAATDKALAGDTVYVAEGTYDGAAEGAQKSSEDTVALSRVIVPAGVTLEATGEAAKTLIVGAPSTESPDLLGNGPRAVRCVFAHSGSTIRGFTLTGGHTHTNGTDGVSSDREGGAVVCTSTLGVTIEDCMISNNCGRNSTILNANVTRCRIIDNYGGIGESDGGQGAAGSYCNYTGCVIDKNHGKASIHYMKGMNSCTIGNNRSFDDKTVQVIYGKSNVLLNCLLLGALREWHGSSASLYATNCYYTSDITDVFDTDDCSNCVSVSSKLLAVDADFRPIIGQNVVIDQALASCSPATIGATDLTGSPRIMNGAMDVGALEADWRPTYAAALGRKVAVGTVDASVTTNAAGGVRLPSGTLAGSFTDGGFASATFEITGTGTLSVSVGESLVGSYTAGTTTTALGNVSAGATYKFVYTPGENDTGAAILSSLAVRKGLLLMFR